MFFTNLIFLDYSVNGQYGFQDAATVVMYGIINLHHHIMNLIIGVLFFVGIIFYKTYQFSVYYEKNNIFDLVLNFRKIFYILFNYSIYYYNSAFGLLNNTYLINIRKLKNWYRFDVSHGVNLEIIWTFVPSFILLLIVGPSFSLLYTMDSCINPDITVKIIGHQWYWSFEYTDAFVCDSMSASQSLIGQKLISWDMYQHAVFDVSVDSYMVSLTDLKFGELRLLEVDNPLYLPAHTKVRLDITASDVIHSFAVPSLGVKVDAIPGRINVAYLEIIRCGIYFGQCSELCGVNHGFMPLKIIVTDSDIFLFNVMTHFNTLYSWLNNISIFQNNLFLKNITTI